MTNDADWVADVRRWYFSTQDPVRAATGEPEPPHIGYEAAHPALQSPNWPDAPRVSERKEFS